MVGKSGLREMWGCLLTQKARARINIKHSISKAWVTKYFVGEGAELGKYGGNPFGKKAEIPRNLP